MKRVLEWIVFKVAAILFPHSRKDTSPVCDLVVVFLCGMVSWILGVLAGLPDHHPVFLGVLASLASLATFRILDFFGK